MWCDPEPERFLHEELKEHKVNQKNPPTPGDGTSTLEVQQECRGVVSVSTYRISLFDFGLLLAF